MMRTRVIPLGVLLTLGAAATGQVPESPSPEKLDVWPGPPPGDKEDGSIGEEVAKKNAAGAVTSLTKVSKPTLTIYRPEGSKDMGVAILVCPGGGYNNLAWDHEGEQVA